MCGHIILNAFNVQLCFVIYNSSFALLFGELSMTLVSASERGAQNISNTRSYEILPASLAAVMHVLTNLSYECNMIR